jgi:hypothetical protein
MGIVFRLDFFHLSDFTTPARTRRSKKREQEFERIMDEGQGRHIAVSASGEVLSDLPLYEALLIAGYDLIAVVVVIGPAVPEVIKAALAFAANYPLPAIGPEMMHVWARIMREPRDE